MLAVQSYLLSGKKLEDLEKDLAIKVFEHPHLPLVGMSYSQIDSPKYHPIVREARGLVLEKDTWNIVARAFNRFFNLGEDQEVRDGYLGQLDFDWGNFVTNVKEDGSLALLYYYDGDWHMNTRGSFGLGEMGFSGRSWREVFWETWNADGRGPSKIDELHPDDTYVFEFWTPYNEVVRSYDKPSLFLLSVFNNVENKEYSHLYADDLAKNAGFQRPEAFEFKNADEVKAFLKTKEVSDKTFEGFVLRDKNNVRIKVKSETYLAVHHLLDNSQIFNPSRQVPLVLQGETSEVLAVLKDKIDRCPALKERIEKTKAEVEGAWDGVLATWRQLQDPMFENQKNFAIRLMKGGAEAKPLTPFHGLLFANRKQKGDEKTLRAMWLDSTDLIVKVLYGTAGS